MNVPRSPPQDTPDRHCSQLRTRFVRGVLHKGPWARLLELFNEQIDESRAGIRFEAELVNHLSILVNMFYDMALVCIITADGC